MSQAFSLYGELTVRQNLTLHARLFHLPRETIVVGRTSSRLSSACRYTSTDCRMPSHWEFDNGYRWPLPLSIGPKC